MPSATAPEETITTSLPSARSSAIWRPHCEMAPSSRPRPSFVTSVEPTFTTMRLPSRTGDASASPVVADVARSLPMHRPLFVFARAIEAHVGLGLVAWTDRLEVLVDRQAQRFAAFARQRRDGEHPRNRHRAAATPTIAPDEVGDARLALGLGNHVDLVQHQPARLLGQRRVVLAKLAHDCSGVPDRIGLRI